MYDKERILTIRCEQNRCIDRVTELLEKSTSLQEETEEADELNFLLQFALPTLLDREVEWVEENVEENGLL